MLHFAVPLFSLHQQPINGKMNPKERKFVGKGQELFMLDVTNRMDQDLEMLSEKAHQSGFKINIELNND